MSLKAQLGSDTPIRRFFKQHFPLVTPLVRKINKSSPAIRVSPSSGDVSMMTIGTAFDYRACAYFGPRDANTTVAASGRRWLRKGLGEHFAKRRSPGENPQTGDIILDDGCFASPSAARGVLCDALFAHVAEVFEHVGQGKKLPADREDEINRACIVLADFEDFGRKPFARPSQRLTKAFADSNASVDSVFAGLTSSEDALRDLRDLSWLFLDKWSGLLSLDTIMKPVFTGSQDVGGADADLIVDGTLYELKVLRKGVQGRDLLQILAYLLLDYTDEHEIHAVGLYSARFGHRWTMEREEFVRTLSAEDTAVSGWRDRLRAELASQRRPRR